MSQPIDHVLITEGDAGHGNLIEAELLRSLRETLPQAMNGPVVLSAKDAEGRVVGGVVASTSYGWLLIKSLWVDERHRGRALGRRLMQYAEERAKTIGCHGAWLDTSSPKARRFYEKLGYKDFGRLANGTAQNPEGHQRWLMKKAL